MFRHITCKNVIFLDLSNSIKIISTFGVNRNGVKANQGTVINLNDDGTDAEYYCPHCKKDIPTNEIYAQCYQCGHEHPIDDMKRPTNSGGIYCDDCARKYFPDEEIRSYAKLAKKISVQKNNN